MGEYAVRGEDLVAMSDAVQQVGEQHGRWRGAVDLGVLASALPGSASGVLAAGAQERWTGVLDAVSQACAAHARAGTASAAGFVATDDAGSAMLRSAGAAR